MMKICRSRKLIYAHVRERNFTNFFKPINKKNFLENWKRATSFDKIFFILLNFNEYKKTENIILLHVCFHYVVHTLLNILLPFQNDFHFLKYKKIKFFQITFFLSTITTPINKFFTSICRWLKIKWWEHCTTWTCFKW